MKVGLCGLGDRLSYVAKVMSERVPNFELVAYSDPSPSRLNYMVKNGIDYLKGYDTLPEMLAKESLDFLMVGSPNHLHLEHIRLGLEAGLKIFTEKPVVINEQQTFELLDLLKQYDAVDNVLVGMVLRYSPLYKDLIGAIKKGSLGDLVSVEASEHIAPEHGAFFMRDWRRNVEMSGGFMLEKCCHDLDIYQGAIGSRAARVVSFGGRKTFIPENNRLEKNPVYHERKTRWNGIDTAFSGDSGLVDHQTALIEYENGVNLTFHTNLNVPDEFRHFCVMGTDGMAEGDFVRNYFAVHDAISSKKEIYKTYDHDTEISMHYGAEEQMANDWSQYFSQSDTTQLPVSILDALEAGLTAIKLDESRNQGRIIDMSDTWERFDSYNLKASLVSKEKSIG